MTRPIIPCLLMLVAVCHASKNKDAVDLIERLLALESRGHKNVEVLDSPELLQKMRSYRAAKIASISKSKRHLVSHCDNAHVELEDTLGEVEEGMIIYPKELSYLLKPSTRTHGQNHEPPCSFQLSVDEDHEIVVYVFMGSMNETLPACGLDGAGKLKFYAGTDAETGVLLETACGEYEKVFIPHENELHFTFQRDPTAQIAFFIYYEIIQKEEVMESVDLGEDENRPSTVAPVGHTGIASTGAPEAVLAGKQDAALRRRAFELMMAALKQATGAETGSGTWAETGADTGAWSGTGAGSGTGTDAGTGAAPPADTGADPSAEADEVPAETGAVHHHDTGAGHHHDTGAGHHETGAVHHHDTGAVPPADTGATSNSEAVAAAVRRAFARMRLALKQGTGAETGSGTWAETGAGTGAWSGTGAGSGTGTDAGTGAAPPADTGADPSAEADEVPAETGAVHHQETGAVNHHDTGAVPPADTGATSNSEAVAAAVRRALARMRLALKQGTGAETGSGTWAETGAGTGAGSGTGTDAGTGAAPPADTGADPSAEADEVPAETGAVHHHDTGAVPPADTGAVPPADTGATSNSEAVAAAVRRAFERLRTAEKRKSRHH